LVVFHTKAPSKRDQFNTLISTGKAFLVLCHTKVLLNKMAWKPMKSAL